MKSITRQKPFEEITGLIAGFDRFFIIGCGTCTTMTQTGGMEQVADMKERLQEMEKRVTGWTVVPVACDEMTGVSMEDHSHALGEADCIISMSCALGVNRMCAYLDRPVIPALDTLFIGVEDIPGSFHEVCAQCGQCVLGETAGICPITACHKGLLNGPCGGTNNGKCEVDAEKDCAWTLIHRKLEEQGRLDMMKKYFPPHNFQAVLSPKSVRISR